VLHNLTGLVAETTTDAAASVQQLLEDPALAERLGQRGREHVADKFLITRYLRDCLRILNETKRD
jgi:hypothetical protein